MEHRKVSSGRRRSPASGRVGRVALPLLALCLGCAALLARAAEPAGFDAAAAFGARPGLLDVSLSPDGNHIAYIVPAKGRGTVLLNASLAKGVEEAKGKPIAFLDGKPWRLLHCGWVSNQRLVCQVYGIVQDTTLTSELMAVSRLDAVDADGSNIRQLSAPRNQYSRGYLLHDGDIIDWLPDEEGAVLMSRRYTSDAHLGTHIGSNDEGMGVDRVDTRDLSTRHIVAPRPDAFEYLSDGRGTVRIMGISAKDATGYLNGRYIFLYRTQGSTEWRTLSEYDSRARSGFEPVAVDHDLNVAYGFRRSDGRMALYMKKLDASLEEQPVFSRPDVDLSGVMRIGRRQRVVGVSFVTDRRQSEVFEPQIKRELAAISRALPQQPLLRVIDSSLDESKLIVMAGSDTDPGVYYVFDRKARSLATFSVVRDELEHVQLAKVKPIMYPAGDGVLIPGYLTLPPGQESAHGLPAIVLPHGGPSARDEWGFDWLSQYFANRGYAVLQPNFRGSAGYGDAWFQQNGFRSWRTAIGDVLAAGRWLVSEKIADPARLGVVGWSYGGYAALQSAVVDPTVFKAVIAIAPVTDLAGLVEERRYWTDYQVVREFVGEGAQVEEGSPIEHASAFKVPVLLFHGTLDRNVGYRQSEHMAERLKAAGVNADVVIFKDLDHQLDDSAARTEMLRRSDEFLRAALH